VLIAFGAGLFAFVKGVVGGFLDELGSDAYKALKSVLVNLVKAYKLSAYHYYTQIYLLVQHGEAWVAVRLEIRLPQDNWDRPLTDAEITAQLRDQILSLERD